MYRNNLSQIKHNVNWVKKELNTGIEHCFHALNNAIIVLYIQVLTADKSK